LNLVIVLRTGHANALQMIEGMSFQARNKRKDDDAVNYTPADDQAANW
jgi:hypothetical protein